ncbi:MAG: radical SAM protein [Paludibacteraceae bacterium]|nr:radical SAM protein [Paludibacteraceae bacterium]
MSVVSVKSLANHLLAECCHLLSRIGIECAPPMPTFLSVEPANICQLACPQCPVGKAAANRVCTGEPTAKQPRTQIRDRHLLDLQQFQTILAQTRGYVHTIQFFFQGEPLLNRDLPEMIRLAHEQHIYTVTSTNAQALTPQLATRLIQSGLDRIIVSIDGLSDESYTAYRQGGSIEQALAGLTYLRQAKQAVNGHTHIELQCLRLRSNESEWDTFRKQYRQLGADSLTLKTAQIYDYEHGNPLMPSDNRYSRYAPMPDGTYLPKNRLPHWYNRLLPHQPCHRLLTGCVITVNGDVLPCCFDKSHRHTMGNIFASPAQEKAATSLYAIWHSDAFRTFRHQVRMSRSHFTMCDNCTE